MGVLKTRALLFGVHIRAVFFRNSLEHGVASPWWFGKQCLRSARWRRPAVKSASDVGTWFKKPRVLHEPRKHRVLTIKGLPGFV